ncbi:MAG: hypothetical protein CMF60_03060 [Magnetococcales bacterium]|nr:hypothetical protein [Magnetococcales bacterium]|tara:strand:+ start:17265 stop:19115 length:1851 start_codon:yes stop_codon:yes gene_type:complete
MNSGYEVCIFKDNRWEVHSFFDEDQPDDATYQAQDIANNYQAVCVLHPAKMQVVFYKNKNPRTKKPAYMDIRRDLKLGSKKPSSPRTYVARGVPKLKQPKPEPIEPKDPHFTKEDERSAVITTLIVGFCGLILSGIIPAFLPENTATAIKLLLVFITIGATSFACAVTYQLCEQTARDKNKEKDFEHDASWRKAGLSKDVLNKLKEKKTPEMEQALAQATPDVQKNIDKSKAEYQKQKASRHTTNKDSDTPQKVSTPVQRDENEVSIEAVEGNPALQAASSAQTAIEPAQEIPTEEQINNTGGFDERDSEPKVENPLAQTSLKEVLTEMCEAIQLTSYDNATQSLDKKHILPAALYLAGATSYLTKTLDLPTKTIRDMVPLFLTRLDVHPSESEGIMKQLSHYINTPRHAILFDRGVTDAKLRADNGNAYYNYDDALERWHELNKQRDTESFFAVVLFTDIESFTEQTQQNGEAWMVDVLHAHNDLTRQIISSFGGHEIKHMGDGMLITFSNVHKALHAAITIQRGVEIFNKSMPNRQFKLRIGISAGDIVSIDNDIFGTPVNLAARMMHKIDGQQIAVTEHLHGMTNQEETFSYTPYGEVSLKGLETQHIYLLNW